MVKSWHIPRTLSYEALRLLSSLPVSEIERRLRMEPAAVANEPSDADLLQRQCLIEPPSWCDDGQAHAWHAGWEARDEMLLQPWPPVPVSKRLPGDQLCWWFESDEDCGYGSTWTLLRIKGSATGYTHWLPVGALPLPITTPAGQEGA